MKTASYGATAIDMNGEGETDLLIEGLNQHESDVVTLTVPECAKWLGARVTAISDAGTSHTREVNNAIGMQTDQSPHL